jgi:hypothetical protein
MWIAVIAMAALLVGYGSWRLLALFNTMDPKVAEKPPMTPATAETNPADAPIGPPGANQESRLDEGIEESFPASDPVSVHIE